MNHSLILATAIALMPVAAQGQSAPAPAPAAATAPVAEPEPARLAAAAQLIDLMLPPATRAQMIDGMMRPMLANLQTGLTSNPQFRGMMDANPQGRAVFEAFMARQNARMGEQMRAMLPGMSVAMTRAYARRFTVEQLREIRAFFETPSGRAYMAASFTIMADPDVAAWQRRMMSESMSHVQEDIAALATDMAKVTRDSGK